MKKQIKVFLLAYIGVVCLLFIASSCHKTPDPNPEPDLPTATQEGKGTIGCYFNGVPWLREYFLPTLKAYRNCSFIFFVNHSLSAYG